MHQKLPPLVSYKHAQNFYNPPPLQNPTFRQIVKLSDALQITSFCLINIPRSSFIQFYLLKSEEGGEGVYGHPVYQLFTVQYFISLFFKFVKDQTLQSAALISDTLQIMNPDYFITSSSNAVYYGSAVISKFWLSVTFFYNDR